MNTYRAGRTLKWAAIALALIADAQGQSSCGPSPVGATCAGGGPASLGNTSGTDQGAGNPINVITGNKYQRETDMAALPGDLGLEIIRHYNSLDKSTGSMGVGWRHSYETEILASRETIQVLEADGSRVIFTRDPRHRSLCATTDPTHGRMQILNDSHGISGFMWTWPNGRQLRFNAGGKLQSITAPQGRMLTLVRNPRGELLSITDPLGRQLRFEYARRDASGFKGVIAIDSPLGRFTYDHADDPDRPDVGNLIRVTLSDRRTVRDYFYEPRHQAGNAHALTGIGVHFAGDSSTAGSRQRLSTYAYQQGGRALWSMRGAGLETIAIAQAPAMQASQGRSNAVLINSRGERTDYGFAIIGAEHRLLSATGPGCAHCGENNVRHSYDAQGRLASTNHTHYVRDALGRITHITSPSVIPGRIREFEFVYDAAPRNTGGPVARIERGYSQSGAIERRVELGYDSMGRLQREGRVRYVYDRIGRMAEKYEPGGLVTRYEYDSLSRASRIIRPGGSGIDYRYDARGRVSQISIDGRSERYDYDAADRLSSVLRPNGELLRYRYDAADRVSAITDAAGNKIVFERDSEGLLLSRKFYDPYGKLAQRRDDAMDASFPPSDHIALDSAHRPVGFTDDRGVRAGYSYDDFGRLRSSTTADGGITRFEYDRNDRMIAKVMPSGVKIGFRYDAAGRPVERRTPEGATVIRYGANLRPSAVSFHGGEERYEYDAHFRLITRTSRIGDSEFTIRYRYDATGALIQKQLPGRQILQFIYRRAPMQYAGLLESMVLIDHGRRIPVMSDLNGGGSGISGRRFVLLGMAPYQQELDVERRVVRIGAKGFWEQEFPRSPAPARGYRPPLGRMVSSASRRFNGDGAVEVDGQRRYVWDSEGRLSSVFQNQKIVGTYSYNALGERIQKTSYTDGKPLSTRFMYEQGRLIAEIDDRGRIAKQYLWLDDQPVAMIEGTRVSGIIADQTYAPRVVFDGQRRIDAQAITNLRGSHQYLDAESGLLYNGRRYLDPATQRYLSPDPLGVAGSSDPYEFAGGTPLAKVDLSGLQSQSVLAADESIGGWSLDRKLGYIFEEAAKQIADHELAAALRDLVRPEALATTAIIFSAWSASQFTPYGWVGDIAVAGIGALFLGNAIWDVIDTTYRVARGIGNSRCRSDLLDASSILAHGLSAAAAALGAATVAGGVAGSTRIARLLRTVFDRDLAGLRRSGASAAINQSRFGRFNPARGSYAGRLANREWSELQRASGRSDAHPPWDPRRPVVDTWLNPGDRIYIVQIRGFAPGGWATTRQYASLADARRELAILEQFKRSDYDLVLQEYEVKTAIPIRQGYSGPQVSGWPASENYVGGGNQMQMLVDLGGSQWRQYLNVETTVELTQ